MEVTDQASIKWEQGCHLLMKDENDRRSWGLLKKFLLTGTIEKLFYIEFLFGTRCQVEEKMGKVIVDPISGKQPSTPLYLGKLNAFHASILQYHYVEQEVIGQKSVTHIFNRAADQFVMEEGWPSREEEKA